MTAPQRPLAGRLAIVTGGRKGLGRAMTRQVASHAADNDVFKAIAASGSTMGRVADAAADAIVGTAVYLVTDASSYVTGQMISVDGGAF